MIERDASATIAFFEKICAKRVSQSFKYEFFQKDDIRETISL